MKYRKGLTTALSRSTDGVKQKTIYIVREKNCLQQRPFGLPLLINFVHNLMTPYGCQLLLA
jgi:hypothetical protein